MLVHGFDWDDGNIGKCQRHGLSMEEIETVFTGEPYIMVNESHRAREEHFHAVGLTAKGRHAFIVFTFREGSDGFLIRPISARYMHQKEVEHYEKQKKT